jgi:hypothetical protein
VDEPGAKQCPVADSPISDITMEVVVWLSADLRHSR